MKFAEPIGRTVMKKVLRCCYEITHKASWYFESLLEKYGETLVKN